MVTLTATATVTVTVTVDITIPMNAAALQATKHVVSDFASWIRFMPASPVVITDGTSLNYAAIRRKLVERPSQSAGRKSESAGGCE